VRDLSDAGIRGTMGERELAQRLVALPARTTRTSSAHERNPHPVFQLRRDAAPDATAHFRQWYVHEGYEWLRRRVSQLAPRAGVSPARVVVRDLG